MTTIIIDDEKKARENLIFMIKKNCPEFRIVGEAGDPESIKDLIHLSKPEVIFMDIQIGNTTIFEILNYAWVKDSKVVFTTAYSDYALEGYSFRAVEYLLKPINPKKLKELYERMMSSAENLGQQRSFSHSSNKLILNDSEGMHVIKMNDILYLLGQGNYTSFYLKDKSSKVVSKNLKSFETKLSGFGFFRISKSCIINLQSIKSFIKEDGGTIIMSDESGHHVSRSHKKEFLEKLELLAIA